jgi:hypothetical protein
MLDFEWAFSERIIGAEFISIKENQQFGERLVGIKKWK